MEDEFEIPVTYKDEDLLFKAKLLKLGYFHKIHVEVNGCEVLFELDEEGKFRATFDTAKLVDSKKIDIELIKLIAETLENARK